MCEGQADTPDLFSQRPFQQKWGGSLLISPLHRALYFLVVYEFGFQLAPEAMGSERPVMGERVGVLFGELAVVKVAEFAEAGNGLRNLLRFRGISFPEPAAFQRWNRDDAPACGVPPPAD